MNFCEKTRNKVVVFLFENVALGEELKFNAFPHIIFPSFIV